MPAPPTIKEIARRLNISASTVSRALHDHPSIGLRTKMRVQQLAAELNYEPNQTAIFFQQRKTFTIGVILPELSEAFFSAAISGIEDMAGRHQYSVLMGQSHDEEEREKQIVNTMKKHRVDGLIISIAKNTKDYTHFVSLQQAGIPVVFFDRIPNLADIHYVACDMVAGTVQAVKYLLGKGHRVIGMINGPDKLLASRQREEGYIKAMQKHRLKYDPTLVVSSDLTREGTDKAMSKLLSLKRHPTAIVAFNDYVAMDAVQYAVKKKYKINEDLTFVSYANLPISHYTAFPPVASVEQFPYVQGQRATEALLEILADPTSPWKKVTLESKLVIHTP
ncbi:LacI family DNA-binding transcriptional regulator [Flavitalea sp. BT771]|uniref:LacI family DNA-binding transcriptional regulator n=1 Tax=Flavitalea sp. BT771 TaxID=3063329 RepID=UPI0026E19294|nr:LacI family DNA-binding transcriptional regulator [Flavitalea sp. BT771]MDO6430649.1 LacI family DNA-binding transcriptional regulator [Flavitalea sp. BT771]MDV6219211.1 LacI family DNA-binding transcriptional regulator [Flavitalea sp. BT771]